MDRLHRMLYGLRDEAGGEGDGGGGGAGGDGTPPRAISVELLPEELRDLDDQELKFFLSHTLTGVRKANDENRDLKDRLRQIEAKLATPPAEEKPDPHKDKPLAELILEDPEAAIERVARSKGWLTGMNEVATKTDDALFEVIAAKIEGFSEFEDDVRKLLKDTRSPISRETVMGAFKMVVGERALAERSKKGRKAQNPEPPAPPKGGDKTKDLPEESALEKEIREAHGLDRENWLKHKEGDFGVKLPTSRR